PLDRSPLTLSVPSAQSLQPPSRPSVRLGQHLPACPAFLRILVRPSVPLLCSPRRLLQSVQSSLLLRSIPSVQSTQLSSQPPAARAVQPPAAGWDLLDQSSRFPSLP